MQVFLQKIAQWVTSQHPILLANQKPIADNPFLHMTLPDLGHYQGSLRLGFIYQELCGRLFLANPLFQLLEEEVQLHSNKKTLGAIDFLIEHEHRIEHWEVAIKFYLLHDGLWYGPDSRDRLDIKLDHMLNHQLKMSKHEVFIERFPDYQAIEEKLLMHGRLYTNPFTEQTVPTHCLKFELNLSAVQGFWCYQHQISQIAETLYRLDKPDWIAGEPMIKNKLASLADYSIHCQSESGTFWMIVPDQWPNNAIRQTKKSR